MAITTIASYLTTGSEIESHWIDVNADRVANSLAELALPDGHDVAAFSADLAALQAAITNQEDLDNAVSLATNDRDNQRQNMRQRLINFRETLELKMKSTGYFRGLPKTPAATSSEQKLLRALDDMHSLWTRIDADTTIPNFTPPLVLRGNYTLAGFAADLATLRTYFKNVVEAENDALLGRKNRDVLLDPLRNRMVEYRLAVEVEYGAGHPFVDSLPDVSSSSSPSSSPTPVTLSGQWNDAAQQAEFNWNESTDPELAHYSLRETLGPAYDPANAVEVEQVPAGASSVETASGMTMPGDVGSYKLFVVLNNLDEVGSNTVTITRT